ncbi:MAG: FecR domain-containing protein [Chitinophagaceae bacterium]|nr:FecR domain-containing protein [Chitinophagaceae bacterium]
MNKDQFLFLAARIFSAEASPEEKAQVEAAMQQDASLKAAYEKFKRHWYGSSNTASAFTEQALQNTWNKINAAGSEYNPLQPVSMARKKYAWWRIAAAAALVIGLGITWVLVNTKALSGVEYVEMENKMGVRSNVILPDGTKALLAAGSSLKYPNAFKSAKREITLKGEAFFEVYRDTLHPFIVHTASGDVTVLGTSFNVSAYPEDGEVITAVATGKVSFTTPGSDQTIVLLPGKKARYRIRENQVLLEAVKEEAEWAWTKGKIVFQADSLGRIATALHRYFGKPVYFKSDEYKAYRYTGTFSNHSQAEILEMLNKTKPFPFKITDTSIIIEK